MEMSLSEKDIKGLNPLVLAYIGDAVYEVHIRKYLVNIQKTGVNQLHKKATQFVKAKAQATIVHYLMDTLTEEEITIVKRGRNSKSNTSPKNANISDYHYATGYEALVGYLYLMKRQERLANIIAQSIEFIERQIEDRL
ncbi:Mini-ribonuclease 3 [Irregularibacter muris]|uniref:Mini-ribonuclease 3 n=2 Tax=Irregularibacter muris TaxID=1796619 RepID=A0AAE3HHI7_9FIRM|nr:Mini-ribonuclease 3 [Irregularibacter muris]MCR1898688.1 Mini-ribonuclease 3 [Irregularibacter muris]